MDLAGTDTVMGTPREIPTGNENIYRDMNSRNRSYHCNHATMRPRRARPQGRASIGRLFIKRLALV